MTPNEVHAPMEPTQQPQPQDAPPAQDTPPRPAAPPKPKFSLAQLDALFVQDADNKKLNGTTRTFAVRAHQLIMHMQAMAWNIRALAKARKQDLAQIEENFRILLGDGTPEAPEGSPGAEAEQQPAQADEPQPPAAAPEEQPAPATPPPVVAARPAPPRRRQQNGGAA